MKYTVYKTTNQINGKYYIGVHKTTNPNDAYLGSGNAIKAAVAKYGKENFTKEVLFVCEDDKTAYQKERELVAVNAKSYNIAPGGVGGTMGNMRGKKHRLETKEKMRLSAMGKHIGDKNGNYNKDFSKETREKMRLAKLGKTAHPNTVTALNKYLRGNTHTKGMKWFNNGVKSVLSFTPPEGFSPGRIYNRKE